MRKIISSTVAAVALLASALVFAPPAAAACGISIKRGAYTGAYLCGTDVLDYWYPNGRRETFIVGTNATNNIWHIWQYTPTDPNWSGWVQLPGNGVAKRGVWLSDDPYYPSPAVLVVGTDERYYINYRFVGDWWGWTAV